MKAGEGGVREEVKKRGSSIRGGPGRLGGGSKGI